MAITLPTEKTKPTRDPSRLRWLFYAEPKTGKTTLAAGFNDPLFLVTEKSTEAINAFQIEIKKWEDFKDAVELLLKGNHKFKTVVVDVVDGLYKYCVAFCNNRLGIIHQSDVGFAKGYHSVDNEFEHWMNKLEMSGLGIVFTSHIGEKEIQQKGGGSYVKIIPGLAKRGRDVLEPKVTVIGYLQWEKIKKVGTAKPEFEEKLVLQFKQTSELLVGDRTGRLPDKVILHTIPEGMAKTADTVEEYGRKNFELLAGYFKD
jgi:hypothetical protein